MDIFNTFLSQLCRHPLFIFIAGIIVGAIFYGFFRKLLWVIIGLVILLIIYALYLQFSGGDPNALLDSFSNMYKRVTPATEVSK